MLRTFKAWKGHISFNTCSNEENMESMSIYAKNRCQWSGRMIDLEPESRRYSWSEVVGALGIVTATKVWKGLDGLPKKSVS